MAAAGITEGMLTLAETLLEVDEERGRKTGAWEDSFAVSKPQQDRAEQRRAGVQWETAGIPGPRALAMGPSRCSVYILPKII